MHPGAKVLLAASVLAFGEDDAAVREPAQVASPAAVLGATAARAVEVREGWASYYARAFDGRRTASGVVFDNDAMMAAHPTYPFGTRVRVTNLADGETVEVVVVDRGPARRLRAKGVIIDLSREAAEELGFIDAGRARVRVEKLASTPADDND